MGASCMVTPTYFVHIGSVWHAIRVIIAQGKAAH